MTRRHAFYSKAHIELFRLGNHTTAMRTATDFTRRFRGGAYQEAAAAIRIFAACDGGPAESCREATRALLRRHRDGKYVADAQRITDLHSGE